MVCLQMNLHHLRSISIALLNEEATGGAFSGGGSMLAGAVRADPQMVHPANGDFHLQASSPCIDAGVNVGLIQDYAGSSIVGLPDSAYEY
jgi:hypothetical protein